MHASWERRTTGESKKRGIVKISRSRCLFTAPSNPLPTKGIEYFPLACDGRTRRNPRNNGVARKCYLYPSLLPPALNSTRKKVVFIPRPLFVAVSAAGRLKEGTHGRARQCSSSCFPLAPYTRDDLLNLRGGCPFEYAHARVRGARSEIRGRNSTQNAAAQSIEYSGPPRPYRVHSPDARYIPASPKPAAFSST